MDDPVAEVRRCRSTMAALRLQLVALMGHLPDWVDAQHVLSLARMVAPTFSRARLADEGLMLRMQRFQPEKAFSIHSLLIDWESDFHMAMDLQLVLLELGKGWTHPQAARLAIADFLDIMTRQEACRCAIFVPIAIQ